MPAYRNNIEHLLEELNRIDLLVRLSLEKRKDNYQDDTEVYQGLYISEDEVDIILQAPTLKKEVHSDVELSKIEAIACKIKNKEAESIDKGKELRLHIIKNLFDLSPFEVDILLICLLPELDLKYEKLYSYLHDDVTKKKPTVDLVMCLLGLSTESRFAARECFSPTAKLIKNHLIYLKGDMSEGQMPLLSRSIKMDDRLINYLLGFNEIDPRLSDFTKKIEPKICFEDIILTSDDTLIGLKNYIKRPEILSFYGPYGSGKKMAAEAICRELGTSLIVVDSKVLMKDNSFEIFNLIFREALLQKSSLYFDDFDTLLNEGDVITMPEIIQDLDRFPYWIFLSGKQAWEPKAVFNNHRFISRSFSLPSFPYRKQLWKSFLDKYSNSISDDIDINALASKFNFSGGQIKDATSTAFNIAMAKKTDGPTLTMENIYQGCKAQSNKKLISLAKKIEPHHTWNDIVLPKDIKEQLKEVTGYIKYKGIVYADWGFDEKLSLGKGLNVLFAGPSGTGKTMTAEIIAGEVGLDIYKIDLSSVVSKYIGETEKNLQKIFKEAETSNAILFFDEADALFGKRSETRDSHDRYANIEINYLLQKMEEHEGIVILASNYSQNIDDAFKRRMHFKIDFPMPDKTHRKIIWEKMFPEKSPVSIPRFFFNDIKDATCLGDKLRDSNNPVSKYLWERLTPEVKQLIDSLDGSDAKSSGLSEALVDELNRFICDDNLFDHKCFANIQLKNETQKLVEHRLKGNERTRMNRLLLEEVYPYELTQSYIDFGFLSTLDITGGNIKNITLSAAFLAAGDSGAIRMEHIIKATRREIQKIGKLCMAEEFGNYYEMLEVNTR